MSTNTLPSEGESQKPPPLGLQNNGTAADAVSASDPPTTSTTTNAKESPVQAHAQQATDLTTAAPPQPNAQSYVPSVLEATTDPVTATTGQPAPSQVKDFVSTKPPPASKPTHVASVLEQSNQDNPTTISTSVVEFENGATLQGKNPVSLAPDAQQATTDSTSAEPPSSLLGNGISVQQEVAKSTEHKLLSDHPCTTDGASASTVLQSAAPTESTHDQTAGYAASDSADLDQRSKVSQPPQLNDGATSVDDQQDPPSNPSGIRNGLHNLPAAIKGPSLVTAGSSAATLVEGKTVPRIATTSATAASKPVGDESLPMASKQPPASEPKTDATAQMPADITQPMDFNAAMIAISRLADQTKPKKAPEPAPPANKTSSVSSENKYASLFAPKAGQWDSWQQHVRATAAKQQKAIEAAVAQQQQALASAATQANPIVAVTQANPIVAVAQANPIASIAQANPIASIAKANPIASIAQANLGAQGLREATVTAATTKQQESKSQEPPANTNTINASTLKLKAAPFAAASPVATQPPAAIRQVNSDPTVWYTLSQAAVLAADKHLTWNRINKRKRSDKSDFDKSFPIQDNAHAKKAKVKPSSSQHPTGQRDTRRFEIPARTAKNTAESQYSPQTEERKRSLPLSSGLDSSAHSVIRRRSSASETALAHAGGPFMAGMNPAMHSADQLALFAAALNRQQMQQQQQHQQQHQQQQQENLAQTNVPGLSKALQESSPPSNTPRNADKPMTYLVRQLLGQIPVDRNDPAFVLSPKLVKNASTKIQMVIDKLIEAAVKRIKEKGSTSSAGDPDTKRPEDLNREIQILAQFSQERAIHLLEQNKNIAELQQKLDENLVVINEKRNLLESLRLRVNVNGGIPTAAGLTDDSDHDDTVRTLVQKLHRVIATVQKLKKDIEAYRLVAKQDEIELQQKDDVIKLLRAMIETESTLGQQIANEASAAAVPPPPQQEDKQMEIALLMKDVENRKEALQKQRGYVEHRMKAFMRAAVQSLQKQSSQKRKRS